MRLLLDTHVFVWLAVDPGLVPVRLRKRIVDADEIHVSSATAMEIAVKARRRRLPEGRRILDEWPLAMRALLAWDLPLSVTHMSRAGLLDWEHRDPFDRMLVAQAQLEGLELVTKDTAILAYPDVRTSTWT